MPCEHGVCQRSPSNIVAILVHGDGPPDLPGGLVVAAVLLQRQGLVNGGGGFRTVGDGFTFAVIRTGDRHLVVHRVAGSCRRLLQIHVIGDGVLLAVAKVSFRKPRQSHLNSIGIVVGELIILG